MMDSGIQKFVVVDVETTGFGRHDRIVEIAAVTLDPATWETIDEFDTLINPERDVGPTGVHGISAAMVEAAPTFSDIVPALAGRLQGAVLIAHNLVFDARMLRQEFDNRGVRNDLGDGLCTYRATRQKLYSACDAFDIPLSQQHRALADARATAELARRLRLAKQAHSATSANISVDPQSAIGHTLRRGLADAGTSPMHRVVSRAGLPDCDSIIQQYLDMLDWVLDDGVIDRQERAEMSQLVRDLGISESCLPGCSSRVPRLHHRGCGARWGDQHRRARPDRANRRTAAGPRCEHPGRDACRERQDHHQRKPRVFHRHGEQGSA